MNDTPRISVKHRELWSTCNQKYVTVTKTAEEDARVPNMHECTAAAAAAADVQNEFVSLSWLSLGWRSWQRERSWPQSL